MMAAALLGRADEENEPVLGEAERIAKHRMGDLIIQAEPGAIIRVEQQRHDFWFGTAISHKAWNGEMNEEDQARYREVLLENFNAVVPENVGKWSYNESEPGIYRYDLLDEIFGWCRDHDLRIRGHCVYWAVPKRIRGWLKEIDHDLLYAKTRVRAFDVMTRYRGLVDEWDVNNEMLHGHFFEQRLGVGIRDRMFRWCREANPESVLYVNDYDILKGRDVDAYVEQIEAFKAIGTPVDGIGVQGHFWGEEIPVERVRESFRKLAKLELPIKVTEFDFYQEDPEKQAEGLKQLYTIAFAQPEVNGILMWGFWEGRHWRPNAAPWKKDWTPTPTAKMYRKLVFEDWWTNWEGEADADGRAKIRAFYGKHRVTVNGEVREVELKPSEGRMAVSFVE